MPSDRLAQYDELLRQRRQTERQTVREFKAELALSQCSSFIYLLCEAFHLQWLGRRLVLRRARRP